MYILDSNQYAIKLVTYLLVLVVYFYELIVYMLLEKNAFDSISFFSQCRVIQKIQLLFSKFMKQFLNFQLQSVKYYFHYM